jgi:uncharacterized membrane protein
VNQKEQMGIVFALIVGAGAVFIFAEIVLPQIQVQAAADIKIITQNARYAEGFFTVHWVIEGEVQNIGDTTSGPVTLEGIVRDPSGNAITRGTTTLDAVAPGGYATYSIPITVHMGDTMSTYQVNILSQ